MAANIYVNTTQDDLTFRYSYDEDLTGYSAIVYVYAHADGLTAATQIVGTLSAGTATSYISASISVNSAIFDAQERFITFCEITKSSRNRASRPFAFNVYARGTIST